MAIKAASLYVEVDANTSKAEKKVASFGNALKGLMTGMAMGAGMGLFNAITDGARGAVAGLGSAVQAASDLSETINMMSAVMGSGAKSVMAWSQSAAAALGMTQNQALMAAGTFAAFGKSANMSGQELSTFSTDLVGLAADLGSFYNTSPEEAITAIGAALRGENEPIRRYNVLLDDMALRQAAVKLGIIETTKEALTPQQKVLAATSELWRQTTDAQGDFAKTSGGLAGQQKILTANMDALSVSMGEALLPAMTAFTSAGNDLVTAVLPSLGSLLETYVAPAMLNVAENVTVASEGLGTFLDAVDAGADPVGAFIDAFDLEPWAEQINDAIGFFEEMVNTWDNDMYRMTLATQTWARDFAISINRVATSLNEFSVRGNDWFNWFGQSMATATGNPFTAQDPTQWVKPVTVPGITAEPPVPGTLDRIPTSGWGSASGAYVSGMGGASDLSGQAVAAANLAAAEAADLAGNALKGTFSPATIAAAQSVGGLGDSAKKAADELAAALRGIPGLFGTSQVTQADMDKAAAGLPVNYADDYVRQAADELINGIDLANIDPAEVARSVGLDPSVPAQIIMDELTRQWESGEYFANPENLAKINWQAVKDAALKEANAVLGQQNIIAEALAQGITIESFKPLATDSMADMAVAVSNAVATPENTAALQDAGERAYGVWFQGWQNAANAAPITPPGGGLPGGVPSGISGVGVPTTLTGANGTTTSLTFPDGRRNGTQATAAGRGGVTINATIANDFDLEKVAVRVAQVIQAKRR